MISIKHLLKPPSDMSEEEYLSFLQRWIIVNSYIYYENDDSIFTDHQYDKVAYFLAQRQSEYKGDIKTATQYGYVFHDFDGTTGFDLYHRLKDEDKNIIIRVANHVIWLFKRERGVDEKKRKTKA